MYCISHGSKEMTKTFRIVVLFGRFLTRYYSLRNSVKFQFDESKAQRLNTGSHLFLLTPNVTLYLSRLAKGGALHFFNYMKGSFMKTITNLAMF